MAVHRNFAAGEQHLINKESATISSRLVYKEFKKYIVQYASHVARNGIRAVPKQSLVQNLGIDVIKIYFQNFGSDCPCFPRYVQPCTKHLSDEDSVP